MPSRPALWVLDSSILISYLRFGRHRTFLVTELERGTVFVPGVVFCELYAGAASRQDRADLESLRRAIGGHLLGADEMDWLLAGRCMAYYAQRWGKIRPRDHLADVLVAVSAVKVGAVLASEDLPQMKRWGWVLGKVGRRLTVQRVTE